MINEGLSIIIPTTNREKIFLKTLDALFNATINIPHEIIVINDSKTQNVTIPNKYIDKIKLINNPRQGLASVRNLGVEISIYDFILFIDDDILIKPNTIVELIKLSVKYPNVPINFNWIYPETLTERISKTQFGRYLIKNGFTSLKGWSKDLVWNDNEVFKPHLMASYFLLISKKIVNSIGGYHDRLPQTAEDFEFATELNEFGITGLVDPTNCVYHNEEDRVELVPWLNRKLHAGATRRISADLGYDNMSLNASKLKIIIYKLVYLNRSFFYLILKFIPNIKCFDNVYFTITNRLLTSHLYYGYYFTLNK